MMRSFPGNQTKTDLLKIESKVAWIVIFIFIFLSVSALFLGAARSLNILFPIGALMVGIFLYFRNPLIYIGFTWWLWFLTPLVRRLVDYRIGIFTTKSILLTAPFLVTLISIRTIYRNRYRLNNSDNFPFLLCLLSPLYGAFVGIIFQDPNSLAIRFLDFITPVIFGIHLFLNWRNYPQYRDNIERIFLWGILVMGFYGVVQFCIFPEWDRFWLIQSGFTSGGKPFPFQINAWSTMTSNQPFAAVMLAGLLLLLINSKKGFLGIPATSFGYLSFLLARKRTTWGSWIIGFLITLISLNKNHRKQVILTLLITIIFVVPLTQIEPFSDFVGSRFDTLSNLQADNSANSRLKTHEQFLGIALTSFFGQGLGAISFDSGILYSLINVGWFGSILYMSGLILLLFRIFHNSSMNTDPFANVARAIAISAFLQIPLAKPYVEAQGMVFWTFLSMALAAKKYYRYQKIISN